MCSCGKEPETTLHYLLRCDLYSIYLLELLNDVCVLNGSLKNSSEEKPLKILLDGAEDFTSQLNSKILNCRIKFIKKLDCFSGPLSLSQFVFFFIFFSLSKYLGFNIFYMYFMFLCSIYVHNLYSKRYMSS